MNPSDRVLGKGVAGCIGGYRVAESLACRFQQVPMVDLKPLVDRFQIASGFYFFASSVCGYAAGKQPDPKVTALRESDAYPAEAEDGYGWEKLFSERMCRRFREDYGLSTRGRPLPQRLWPGRHLRGRTREGLGANPPQGDRGQADGQARSESTQQIMQSSVHEPLNLGSDQLVTIERLVDMVEAIAGGKLQRPTSWTPRRGAAGATATAPRSANASAGRPRSRSETVSRRPTPGSTAG